MINPISHSLLIILWYTNIAIENHKVYEVNERTKWVFSMVM